MKTQWYWFSKRSSAGQRHRTHDYGAYIEQPLLHIRDDDLATDVEEFHRVSLSNVDCGRLLRAAKVGKNLKTYQDISRDTGTVPGTGLVELSNEEKQAMVKEEESLSPEPGMRVVILTVSLAAFLQGHVQSSINGASLYSDMFDLSCSNDRAADAHTTIHPTAPRWCDWALGATNAMPFLAAALFGCWLALPISDRFGRKGSMVVAAVLVLLSSLAAAIVPFISTATPKWVILLVIRIFNGIGMGVKAVNTPILASETAIGYWRGTSILAWQLWVACGILVGFGCNIGLSFINNRKFALAFILGAPIIPSIFLLGALFVCPESPRWYMRRGPNYNPQKAYDVLKSLRKCELIALRDIYVLYKSIQREQEGGAEQTASEFAHRMQEKEYNGLFSFLKQFGELFSRMRLRNALISSSIVALAQQLCGINILAFYSGTLFTRIWDDGTTSLDSLTKNAMYFSLGFGAINFFFGIPAIGTIDTIGRRKWLNVTLPIMAILLASAALSFLAVLEDPGSRRKTGGLAITFLYLHAVAYSPGLGPVPFTLAAESFPLANREVGCAFAVSTNLLFAGILSICFPAINAALSTPGCLAAFSGFTLVAFVLVFLFVEETRRISLEGLDYIYEVPKREFAKFQLCQYLPWLVKTCIYDRFRSVFRDSENKIPLAQPPVLYFPRTRETSSPAHESIELTQNYGSDRAA
ncbi:hypothetical protein BGZ63DRAFT_467104 [Mariannaea sp. PMI_226]|nr:hypothetical protein BGZ63DRAFT_467104 [Mariannaea sp. PMI_226]